MKRRVSRRLGMDSVLWAGCVEEVEQKARNGQWTMASCVEEGEQRTRNGQWTLASSEEEGEQKTRNGQFTLGRLCRGG